MADQNLLMDFINQLMNDAGFKAMDPDFENAYREKMQLSLMRRLGSAALTLLDEQGYKDFITLMEQQGDTPNPTAALAFFQQRVPDFETRVQEILQSFRIDYLDAAAATQV